MRRRPPRSDSLMKKSILPGGHPFRYTLCLVAIRYEIEDGALVLSVAVEGFAMLRDALDAAVADPRVRPEMPVLLDARSEPVGIHFEDVRWRQLVLSQMRQQFGRWAILTETPPVRVGLARMFAAFSEIEGLEVGLFADEDAAFTWLRG